MASSGNVTDEVILEYIRTQDNVEPTDGGDGFRISGQIGDFSNTDGLPLMVTTKKLTCAKLSTPFFTGSELDANGEIFPPHDSP